LHAQQYPPEVNRPAEKTLKEIGVTDDRWRAFGYRIGILHRLYFLCIKRVTADTRFPASLIPFLTELHHQDGITQDMLSARVSVDKGTTARAVALLERKRLVRRGENRLNRRQKLVYLTPKALKESKSFFTPLHKASEIMTEGVSTERRDEILNAFDRMTANLKRELNAFEMKPMRKQATRNHLLSR
jgi:DNA-binding MarR family transcriptional regulator